MPIPRLPEIELHLLPSQRRPGAPLEVECRLRERNVAYPLLSSSAPGVRSLASSSLPPVSFSPPQPSSGANSSWTPQPPAIAMVEGAGTASPAPPESDSEVEAQGDSGAELLGGSDVEVQGGFGGEAVAVDGGIVSADDYHL